MCVVLDITADRNLSEVSHASLVKDNVIRENRHELFV